MKRLPRTPYLVSLGVVLALFLFYHFGGPIWRPIKARIVGEKTVSGVLAELDAKVSSRFTDIETLTDGREIALLAFKEEQVLELWKKGDGVWRFIRSYPFTGFSGGLGPKLKEGDYQIPEGVYSVESLNPNSSFHLSIKLNYPNDFDQRMAKGDGRTGLGYDIFIHGANATIGCIPVGDAKIEEIFYVVAKNGIGATRVIIAPRDFRKGKSDPVIEKIEWEAELYGKLRKALQEFEGIQPEP